MSDQAARARRVAEVALFAPFGLIAYLRDAAPTLLTVLVARGRGEVDRTWSDIGRRVQHVRNYGDAAIAFGIRQPRQVEEEPSEPDAESVTSADVEPVERERHGEPRPDAAIDSNDDDRRSEGNGETATSEDLAIPGYDSLSASQVVERLAGLDDHQLDAVRTYETETRRRRTILGKIEQLTA